MNKVQKLLTLILMSLSVYFIYQSTNQKTIKIISLGDGISLGINSYGIKEYSPVEYMKDYLQKQQKAIQIKTYADKEIMIKELTEQIKTNNTIKRDLLEAHLLVLSIGYNDVIYKLSLEESDYFSSRKQLTEIKKDYEFLIKEIRKYYKNEIIQIGFYGTNKNDYYCKKELLELNKFFQTQLEISYVDTYNSLKNRKKYFSNPNNNYPNRLGYQEISKKIITKTLENH